MDKQEAIEIAVTVGDAAILIAALRDYAVHTLGHERAVCFSYAHEIEIAAGIDTKAATRELLASIDRLIGP